MKINRLTPNGWRRIHKGTVLMHLIFTKAEIRTPFRAFWAKVEAGTEMEIDKGYPEGELFIITRGSMISQYNSDWNKSKPAFPHLINLHFKRARIEGFICLDYPDKTPQAMTNLGQWLVEGKLKYRIEVIEGLENALGAVNKNFDGSNRGKLICRISEEP